MHYDHQSNIAPVKKEEKKERKDLPARLAEHNWTHNQPAETPPLQTQPLFSTMDSSCAAPKPIKAYVNMPPETLGVS